MTLMNGPLFGSILVKPGMAIVKKFIISGLRIIQDSIRVGSNFLIISDIPRNSTETETIWEFHTLPVINSWP